jgi:hypothetical protein
VKQEGGNSPPVHSPSAELGSGRLRTEGKGRGTAYKQKSKVMGLG